MMKKNILFFTALFLLCIITSCNNSRQQTNDTTTHKTKIQRPNKSIENLKRAIKGEINAQAKYRAFADKAEKEGYKNISKLFSATSQAESIHVRNHKSSLSKFDIRFEAIPDRVTTGTTVKNLQNAIDDETYESTDMYSSYIEIAIDEKTKNASISFNWALKAEKKHALLHKETLDILQTYGNDRKVSETWYICRMCGNIYNNLKESDICEICSIGNNTFIIIK